MPLVGQQQVVDGFALPARLHLMNVPGGPCIEAVQPEAQMQLQLWPSRLESVVSDRLTDMSGIFIQDV